MAKKTHRYNDDLPAPTFASVRQGVAPGVYSSRRLNPPSGDDCVTLVVDDDGLHWGDRDGVIAGDGACAFTARDLCAV